jgi:multidrug efflux pump subunit AcrA (membrane-fusion protein)
MSGIVVKYLLPLAALALLGFAVFHVGHTPAWQPLASPPQTPSEPPFPAALVARGVVRAGGGNVHVAAPVPGVVTEVPVQVGQEVREGEVLFRLDDRALRAELRARQARLATARAQLARLEQLPRPEQLPASAARVREANAQLLAKEASYRKAQGLAERKLLDDLDVERSRQAARSAREALAQAEAEDALLRAGASAADKAVARAQVDEAETLVAQVQTELDRLLVRAPRAGTVLQVNVRPGEAVSARPDEAPVVLGNTDFLEVRAELEEQLLAHFDPDAAASACPRGKSEPRFPLHFVRSEALVVPRGVLAGDGSERSDTRVLPLIYRLDPGVRAFHVGQQVEVYLERK